MSALKSRLRAGDIDALGEFYEIHQRIIFLLLLKSVGRADAAEGLVIEAFIRAWTRRHELDAEPLELGAWLVEIARECARDFHCGKKKPLRDSDAEEEKQAILSLRLRPLE